MSVRTEVSASQRGGHRGFEGAHSPPIVGEGGGAETQRQLLEILEHGGSRTKCQCRSFIWNGCARSEEGRSGGWGSWRRNHYSVLPVRNEVVGLAKETAGGQVKGKLVSAQSHQAKGAYDRPLRPALLAYFREPIDCVYSVYMCLCVSLCVFVCVSVCLCMCFPG